MGKVPHGIRYVCYDTPHRKDCVAKVVIPHKLGGDPKKIQHYCAELVRKWHGKLNYITNDHNTSHPKVPKTVRMDRNSNRIGHKPKKGRMYKEGTTGPKVEVAGKKQGVVEAQVLKHGKVKTDYIMGTPQFKKFKRAKHLHKTSG